MHSRRRSEAGLTLVEVITSVMILMLILAAGMSLFDTGFSLSTTSTYQSSAMMKVSRVLSACGDSLRRAKLSTLTQYSDGTSFVSGESDTGYTVDEVTDYGTGGSIVSTRTIRWLGSAGTPGDVARVDGGLTRVLARNVSNFQISRNGRLLTVTVSVTEGPGNDTDRSATGTIEIDPRN